MRTWLLLSALAAAAAPALADDDACLACHANRETGAPQMSAAADWKGSVHKDAGCGACHADKEAVPHGKPAASVSCDACHRMSADAVRASDHGKLLLRSMRGASLCLACHGKPHALRRAKDPASPVQRLNIPGTCNQCHGKLDFKDRFGVEPMASYAETVHGKAFLGRKNPAAAVCSDCHGQHDLNFAGNSRSRANKANIPRTCGRCHAGPLASYSRSIHGVKHEERVKDAPVCTDCHGEHNIRGYHEPGSMVFTGSVVKTCGHCHGSERLIAKFGMPLDPSKTYLDSYHGVAFKAGNLSSANCASCHRHHEVLPSSDPESSVNPRNLKKTCGACHPRAGDLLHLGKVHLEFSTASRDLRGAVMRLVRGAYIWLILLTIGGMLLHNLLDHKRKLLLGPEPVHSAGDVRMSLNERVQHFVLFVSFAGLAYTGFCHTYPQSLPAAAVFKGASGAAMRSLLHRAFAVVFIVLGAYHAVWAAATREGRGALKAMLPRWQDVLDFWRMQIYNLLHRGRRPEFGRFGYIEKAEYWALVWGSVVMVATGCVAWLRDFSLHFLPKWIIDLCLLIHFMEAVLACLAILVWHFYWTILDADVYPMNWAWLTGRVQRPGAQPHEPGRQEPR